MERRGELTLRVAYNLFTQRPREELDDFRKWSAIVRLTGPVVDWLNLDICYFGLRRPDAAFEQEVARANGDIRWERASGARVPGLGSQHRARVPVRAFRPGGDSNDSDLQTINPLFPRRSYFGEASLIRPLNHIDLDPSVTLHAMTDLSIEVDGDFFWRESLADGLYRSSGSLQVSGAGNSEWYVGAQALLTVELKLDPCRH